MTEPDYEYTPDDPDAEAIATILGLPHGEPPGGWGDTDPAEPNYAIPGGAFILDAAEEPEPVWGRGSEVLWSRGESLIITGSIGAGKTTLFGLLVKASLGLADSVLGYPVEPARRVLYLAADRPAQIARNLRRQFAPEHRRLLDERLVVWRGPMPQDLAKHPTALRRMAREAGLGPGDRIFIDSLKDVAHRLSEDEVGAAVSMALGLCTRDGIDVAANHHQRKASAGKTAAKPKGLADVYGSTWIGSGAGTVLLLWADEAGSSFVELSTLKPAADPVGPVEIHHDIDAGTMSVAERVTAADYLRANRHTCRTASQVVTGIGLDGENRAVRERVRRELNRLEKRGHVERTEHTRPEGGKPESFFQWVSDDPAEAGR